MNKERALTYSLLAHIRNQGTLIKGPLDIFKPLIKRILSKLNAKGIFSGKSIAEIKKEADDLYGIDFPIPVLKKILEQLALEVNTAEKRHFELYQDGSFSILEYTFHEFDDTIKEKEKELGEIEHLFKQFCESSDFDIEQSDSIFKFIEKNKFSLSKYLSDKVEENEKDYTAEAQFIDFFRKIPKIYTQIKNIYIGSIISGYIQYNPSETNIEVELLFDTNFIVGLLDLNTPESAHTCKTLIEIAKKQNYKIKVLKDTLEETKALLEAKSRHFDQSFLQRKVYPEDIYNACDRRNLLKIDLERIADNLEAEISKFDINIIHDSSKFQKEAKFSEEYKYLVKIRGSKTSALHDATASIYVKKKRAKRIKDFDKVNCWFVTNSINREAHDPSSNNGFQPEIINADDLLNILWLSNPQSSLKLDTDDLADIGLTSTISLTLNSDLPHSKILRELDDNIHKYVSDSISDSDIVRVATRITNKQLKDIEELNELASSRKEEFVKRLEEEASKQKSIEEERMKRLENIFNDLTVRTQKLETTRREVEKKGTAATKKVEDAQRIIDEVGGQNKTLRKSLIDEKIKSWQRVSLYLLFISALILSGIYLSIAYSHAWNFKETSKYVVDFKNNLIGVILIWLLAIVMNIFVFKLIYDRFFNTSIIMNKRKQIEEEL